jgi:hypothetical protein
MFTRHLYKGFGGFAADVVAAIDQVHKTLALNGIPQVDGGIGPL